MAAKVSAVSRSASRHANCSGKKSGCQRRRKTRRDNLRVERLEDRLLFTVAPVDSTGLFLSTHGGLCNCPFCTGVGLEQIPTEEVAPAGTSQAPLSSLPQLHSNASASAKLFLDFDGRTTSSWGFYTNINTPVFDQDGDLTTFSSGELSAIYEIWARVAEDYAPFNIDVTTVDPGSMANREVAVIAIGGSYSDWYGSSAGGVAYVGGFFNSSPNVGFVFENNLSSNGKYIAEASSHEAGHLFGLQHQATWNGSTLVESYNSGNGTWAPLMGVGYYAPRTTWHNGATSAGPTAYQDDLSILSGNSNGFGYKADDFGSTTGTASALPNSGGSVNFSGLIGQANDLDVWSFTTTGGAVAFQLTGAQYGSNLDAVLELWNSSGGTIVTDSPSGSQGASISTTVGAGTYYLVARSVGDYGDVGQYTITGSIQASSTAPEIGLTVSGADLADGGTLTFGTTSVGAAVTRTVTVTNYGSAALSLTPLSAGAMPTGFSLVSNLGATSLSPGASTNFVVRLDATTAGTFSGAIQLVSSDSDENPYDIVLSGTATAPEIAIAISGSSVADGQTVDFGSTSVGQSVTRTFTVTNTGSSTLTLTPLTVGSLPAGFTLVSNIASTSLAAGQSTTFSIRLDAASAGSFSGSIQLLNNDGDENPYDIALTGSVAAPEIAVDVGGSSLASGQTVSFGVTIPGQPVSRTFTVTNTGNATLTLSPIDPVTVPAGFTLVNNLGATSLAAGQSTSFTIQLDAASEGSFSGTIVIANSDSDESSFSLQLQGSAVAPSAPDLTVLVSGLQLTDGGLVNFGTTVTGTTLERRFEIHNDGGTPLILSPLDPASLPAGFSIFQDVTDSTLGPGESTSFILRLDAQAAGSYGGQFVLASDDASSPFVIQLSGTVVESITPLVRVLDDGDAGSSAVGSWKRVTGKGYAQDIDTMNKGQGGSVYSWTFGSLPQGEFRVWATWTAAKSNASNAKFSIVDGGTTLSTVVINQRVAPGGLTADGARWKLLGTAAVSSGQLIVKLNNAANGQVVADAIRIERVITVLAPTPDIGVSVGGVELSSGVGAVDFGSPDLGAPQTRTFTVTNRGNASLTLSPLDPASLPAGFSLVGNIGSMFLTPGESTAFTLRLDADSPGTFSGAVSLASTDPDESTFNLQVTGTVYDPTAPITRIIDDANPGNARGGFWKRVTTKGYSGDLSTAVGGTGSSKSTWNFTNLPNGEYKIQATWKAATNQATNAPYTFFDGSRQAGAVRVTQRVAPGDQWDGAWWKNLGTITVTNHQLIVKLSNSANGVVVADAIRIEKVFGVGQAPSIESLTGLFASPFYASAQPSAPSDSNDRSQPVSDSPHVVSLSEALNDAITGIESDVLTNVLGLLAFARQSASGGASVDAILSHDQALSSLIEQLA